MYIAAEERSKTVGGLGVHRFIVTGVCFQGNDGRP
jgi:hypothetical protein